ncbi:hypothetical protein GIB67_037490 [Kingdonia uniflora]|uniref:DUF4378 domain-containing protein n=1 Tax=Kingdonia uniflora TaxID=39325 RepID=A0A7J7KX89_9MAGN|nr:hypothetical protein GIB67_037490 [Kingdonia uniflora]
MSEDLGKMALTLSATSSLAIVEAKKPQTRPGGCVGIFFQLFDWNRRLAKKKLFSKKLLPPARAAKRASKKFGGDDKLPMGKLLLIAEENRGGFPMPKKSDVGVERGREMRAPGLVARLMGLDSMPTVRRDKPKNVGDVIGSGCMRGEVGGCGYDEEGGAGRSRGEFRPEKLQRTGVFERRTVTRFGTAESFQFKSILSPRSRKQQQHHHPKLVSPVKSPRIGRNASRLMDAATKILEPGLQASNRARCALTYSSSLNLPPRDEFLCEDQPEQPGYYSSGAHSLKTQSSCKSCGNLLDVLDTRANVDEQISRGTSSSSDMDIAPFQGSGRNPEIVLPVSCSFEQERFGALVDEVKSNLRMRNKNLNDRKPICRETQDHQPRMTSHRVVKTQKDIASAAPKLKPRSQKQNHMLLAKDRITPTPQPQAQTQLQPSYLQSRRDSFTIGSVNRTKESVPLNQRNRARRPSLDNYDHDKEMNSWYKRDYSSSRLSPPVHKRRPLNNNPRVENPGFVGSSLTKQKNVGGNVVTAKVKGLGDSSMNQNRVKIERPREKGAETGGKKDAGIVSFTFSSPMRQNAQSSFPSERTKKIRDQVDVTSRRDLHQKKLTLDVNRQKPSIRREGELNGDAIGALLEEKLKELTCRDRDEFETGDALPARSAASILEELISALTAGRPSSNDEENKRSDELSPEDSLCYNSLDSSNHNSLHGQTLNTNRKSQGEAKASKVLVELPISGDNDQPSPASVLEACFSNDSCFSESLNGSSERIMYHDSMECSHAQMQPSGRDADLSDSATSLKAGEARNDKMTDFSNNISSALAGCNLANIGLVGEKLNHVRDVIASADLLFGNNTLYNAYGEENFPIGPLLDKMEILSVGFMEAKADSHQRRKFLFDCVIECFESKYIDYCNSRFKFMPGLHLHANEELPTREVYEDIKRWDDFSGRSIDDLIETEISRSLGKWTNFETEASEASSEIEFQILELLLDEIVTDFCQYRRTGSSPIG